MQLGLSPAGDLWPSVESSLPEEPRVLGDSAAMLSSGPCSTMGVLAMATETTVPVIHFTTPTPTFLFEVRGGQSLLLLERISCCLLHRLGGWEWGSSSNLPPDRFPPSPPKALAVAAGTGGSWQMACLSF